MSDKSVTFVRDPDESGFAEVIVDGVERGYVGWQPERFHGRTGRRFQEAGWHALLIYGPDGQILDFCPQVLCGSQRQAERAVLRMLAGEWR